MIRKSETGEEEDEKEKRANEESLWFECLWSVIIADAQISRKSTIVDKKKRL